VAGTPPAVDDGVACTDDSCDEAGDVVLHQTNDALCSDGQFCNGDETCDAVSDCQPGVPPDVDDGVACTNDSCDEAGDAVVHWANDALCSDGLVCNGSETCDALNDCQPGIPLDIDDAVACTDDACDEVNDLVSHFENDSLCADADPCTADVCDVLNGCSNEPIPSCGSPIAATPGRGLAFLASILLISGAALLAGRERIVARRADR
jgi:hypothetical protein